MFIERGGVWAGLPGLVPAFSGAVHQVLGGIDVIRNRYPGLGFGEERRLSARSPCETERLARKAGSAWTGRNLSRWPISGIYGPPGLLGREEVPVGRSVLVGLRGEGTALGVAAVYVEDPFAQGTAVRGEGRGDPPRFPEEGPFRDSRHSGYPGRVGRWVQVRGHDPLLPQAPPSPARLARRGDRRPGPVWGPLAWSRPGLHRSRGRVLPLMPAVPGRVEMAACPLLFRLTAWPGRSWTTGSGRRR